jgi:tripartite-type tricarboxylate transporter receptor subunit TctC
MSSKLGRSLNGMMRQLRSCRGPLAVCCLWWAALFMGFTASRSLAGSKLPEANAAVADFYRGKTITIVSGSDAGGGYDLAARELSRFMAKYIPGHPNIIVQNMPGAASLVATNYVYESAPRDGTFIAGVQRTIPFQRLFSDSGVRYDATKMQWLGSIARDFAVVAVWGTAPQKTFADTKTMQTVVGSVGVSGDNDLFPRVLNRTLGTKFQIVGGYPGQSQIVLAMQRQEVQGTAHWSWSDIQSQHKDWLENGTIRPLLQLGLQGEESPYLKGVPVIMDVAPDEETRTIFKILISMLTLGRPMFLAPGVPAERVAALRKAFDATMKDPEFLKEGARVLGEISPVSGVDMQKIVADLYLTSPETIRRLREVVK